MPDTVNEQVVDAVTASNVKVLAEAPGVAMGTVFSALSQNVALTMSNTTTTQAGLQVLGLATSVTGTIQILKQLNKAT